ncbi:MAG: Glu-tRNA(Gln) amidotransferase subunit GatE [Nanoarchaeota archaeon]|nr:Glu-tRNA(Gln) amidotransferase subunit GatE [Nanoarchaeota archaeon]
MSKGKHKAKTQEAKHETQEEKAQGKDYEKIGLKAGLEIHQQLNTHKLFCDCPSELRDDKPDVIRERYQHAVAGEEGKIDIAAEYEQERKRKFIYEAYSDTTCLIELDEEPPHELNEDALKIAIQISLLLNAKILPTTQVMRKTVVDGSNTSGFQRTLLIAQDGYIETQEGKVGITSIALEEDAARIISKEKNQVTYRLDRLGIPLIEITTEPEIRNPEQAKEVAFQLGEILRACNVKRGIGTIRQDVNVSIKSGTRIEIKGVQDLRLMSKIIENEIERQQKTKKLEPEVRKVLETGKTEFLRPLPGKARMYPETDLPLIHITRELINEVKSKLPKLRQEHRDELEKLGINKEIAQQIVKENQLALFNELLKTKANAGLIAKTITLTTKNIKAHYKVSTENLKVGDYKQVLEAFQQNKITKDAIEYILTDIAKGMKPEKAITSYKALSKTEIENTIKSILKNNPQIKNNSKALMGAAMQKLKGKADGKIIAEIVMGL